MRIVQYKDMMKSYNADRRITRRHRIDRLEVAAPSGTAGHMSRPHSVEPATVTLMRKIMDGSRRIPYVHRFYSCVEHSILTPAATGARVCCRPLNIKTKTSSWQAN